MADRVSAELRRVVATRADYVCEYCLIAEEDTFFGCEVVALKHGGPTEPGNLAYACVFCNRNKGSDIASISQTGNLVRLFNPRTDRWIEHFRLAEHEIRPLTEIGEITARILRLNESERLLERYELKAIGRYPAERAIARMQ
jgi:hypothetical protein